MIKQIINWLLNLFGLVNEEELKKSENIYYKRPFMTPYELRFYQTIQELNDTYNIIPQINLATIVGKRNKGYINELFKNIDFAIFDKDFKNLLLLIEINDSSHQKYRRKDRDLKVKKICNDCGIKLINFYTKYPNEKNYVINRIKKIINDDNASANVMDKQKIEVINKRV